MIYPVDNANNLLNNWGQLNGLVGVQINVKNNGDKIALVHGSPSWIFYPRHNPSAYTRIQNSSKHHQEDFE